MNRFYLTIILFLCTCIVSNGQKKIPSSVLSGIVVDVNVGQPVPDITVFTQFGDVVTDMRGKFNLSLSQCNCQVGEQITIYTMSEEYGYSETKYTITNAGNQNVTLKILRNSNVIYLNGIVKDERTHDPIDSIKVKLLFNNTSSDITAITEKDGTFRLPIPKKILGSESSVRIIYTDEKCRYKQFDELQAINSFAKVFLERSTTVISDNSIVGCKKELMASYKN